MPEGDTVACAANRIRPVLEGRTPDAILTPQPRHDRDGWPERLAGRAIDQRNVAGIGNIWKAEGCWEAGVDPWRAVAEVPTPMRSASSMR